jgi:hypothetical protein
MGSDFLSSRSITDADRDRGRKLARLRRGFCNIELAEADFTRLARLWTPRNTMHG